MRYREGAEKRGPCIKMSNPTYPFWARQNKTPNKTELEVEDLFSLTFFFFFLVGEILKFEGRKGRRSIKG